MDEEYVLLEWMKQLPLKQQSVLLSSLRGPDNANYPTIKKVTKWIRSIVQKNADPTKKYMHLEELPSFGELEKEIEFCSVHYAAHLLQALEIIGYEHPDKNTSSFAENYYKGFALQTFHLNPETREQLTKRLEDRVC